MEWRHTRAPTVEDGAAAAREEAPSPALRRATERLYSELQAAWQILAMLSVELSQSSSFMKEKPKFSGTLRATRTWYEEVSGQLLGNPVDQWLKHRPTHRALVALLACDREISSRALRSRRRIDSRFQRVLVEASLDLCEPWRIWRGGNHAVELEAWEQRRTKRHHEAISLLERYKEWALRDVAGPSHQEGTAPRKATTENWWRQQHSVTAALEMELAFRDLTLAWFNTTDCLANDLQRERAATLSDALATLRWLEASEAAPTQHLKLVSPDERLRTWAAPVEAEATRLLPEKAELLVFDPRLRWRSIPARASFLTVFATYAGTPMRAIVEQSWGNSASTVREVEQAREIVTYWSEGAPRSAGEAPELLAEARQNAIAILKEQAQLPSQPEQLDAQTVNAFWLWHEKGSLALEAEQYGWITLLRRPRGRAIIGTATETGQLKAKATVQRAGGWTSGPPLGIAALWKHFGVLGMGS